MFVEFLSPIFHCLLSTEEMDFFTVAPEEACSRVRMLVFPANYNCFAN